MPTSTIKSCLKAVTVCAVLFLAAVGIKSFVPSGDGREVAPPVPTVRDVSNTAWIEFRQRWISEHEATAAKADEYKSWQEAFDDTGKRLEPIYPDAFRPLGEAIKSGLYGGYDPTDPKAKPPEYDPAKLRDVFTQAAKGAK